MAQNCEAKEYRESIHAGTWYPGKKAELEKMLQTFLKNARMNARGKILGLICPHAGYIYSGPVAAFSYKLLLEQDFDDVIVIGPSHHYGFYGASVDTMAGRITPLGKVDYDLELARKIIKTDENINYRAEAHQQEHSTEIQVPFLQKVLKGFQLVEIVMGSQDYSTCQLLAEAIVKAVGKKKVLIVASSDLSHYHQQKIAEKLDNLVADAVNRYDPELLFRRLSQDSCEACGGGPIITAMLITKELGANKGKVLTYATSGDITGDYSQVVGYLAGAFFIEEKSNIGVELGFSPEEKRLLKEIAKKSIQAAVQGKPSPQFKEIPEKLKENYGVFVTINRHGQLRGCIGHIIGDQPLYLSCAQMAKAAALEDPRFPPVSKEELPELEIEISVLTPLQRVKDFNEIKIGRDGLLIRKGVYSGLLLPQVAVEYGWNVQEFLEQTCHKAGLPSDAYKSKEAEIYKFSAEVF